MVQFSKRVPADGTDAVGAILAAAADPSVVSFAGGLPAPELFPVAEMKKAVDTVFDEHGREAMQYGASRGVTELRELITKRVKEREGIDSKVENVMVTTGSEQVLDLVGKAFIDEGDEVLVEDPTYLCALDVYRSYGAKFVSVPQDDQGLRVDALEEALKNHPKAKLLYTVSNFQNPTGKTMPVDRRKKVAELAAKYDVMVLEDNPYGDIRFEGEHVPAIKAFDTTDHVLYMSTFSKILAPGFRLGWVLGDPKVIDKLTVLKQSTDLHTDQLAQWAVVEFFAQNDINKHVDQISALYGKRKDLMIEGMKKYFPEGVKYTNPEGGMFLWVKVPGVTDTVELFKKCLKEKVAFVPGDPFFAGKPEPGTFRLNYSNMQEDKIEEGLKRLGKALSDAVNENK